MRNYYFYILTNNSRKPFYTGVTNNISKRVFDHKNNFHGSSKFVQKYKLFKLVYHEIFEDVEAAIKREKIIKKWRREIKINQIEKFNKNWEDLYYSLPPH